MNKKELIPFIQINDGPREIAVAWVENYRPYNSSQPEIAQKHKLASDIQNYAIEFADQEKQALKDRITHEATVDSIIWEVLQIDRMSNQEFDSERERRHLQIRKVQEILKSI